MSEGIKKVKELANATRIGMLTTTNANGHLHSRPMALNEIEDDGTMWFFTAKSSDKVNEIQQDSEVNVSFANVSDADYLAIAGTANLVTAQSEIDDKFNHFVKAWFPEGKDSSEISLLKITPHHAEYWDSNDSKLARLFNIGKALITGKKHQDGIHAKVAL